MCKFRTLRAEEIDIRVGNIISSEKGVFSTYLLYKDARVDMNILDETVGSFNWKKFYSRDNQNCTVSIYDEEKHEWISKEDTGTESYTEKEKGLASDSFKRACVCWGIGRELYTAPNIFIPLAAEDYTRKGDKITPKVKLSVKEIEYDENKNIVKLVIVDDKGKVRFNNEQHKKTTQPVATKPEEKVDNAGTREVFIQLINKKIDELIACGVDIFFDEKASKFVKEKAQIENIDIEQLDNDALNRLSNVLVRLVEIKKSTHEKAN